ncbi:mechanosensitive ion channel family protein [Vibrio vulnificus]|uniref:mechanosensitive ion channel family protein n=1 Tax=Vibrio vulnificus TaxID=672 RepID=UPI001028B13D|nr:mechanosensitive ion channel family protein [Vibrio vulnificus]RZR38154.1 mechanosensitive ion channel family protein [Vibrio vulnificus]
MSFLRQKKVKILTLLLTLSLTIPLLSNKVHAQQDEAELNAYPNSGSTLQELQAELVQLIDSLDTLNEQDDLDAIHLSIFDKNERLRGLIDGQVSNEQPNNSNLIYLIEFQQKYNIIATKYLANRRDQLNKLMSKADSDERLSILARYLEMQHYHNELLKDYWENVQWLKTLGVNETKIENKLRDDIKKSLRLASATIELLLHQKNVAFNQLSASDTYESEDLNLNVLVVEQRLQTSLEHLEALIYIADRLNIDTTSYIRLIFKVTGSITHDVLKGKVAYSIASDWLDSASSWVVHSLPSYLFKAILIILILLTTNWLSSVFSQIVNKLVIIKYFNFSKLMQSFIVGISSKFIWSIGIIFSLSQLGMNLSHILTGVGIVSIIIGLALQDTLSNFASGIMLLIYRPFDVGDFVLAAGIDGKVHNMSMVNTTIKTFDNRTIITPNKTIWSDIIINLTNEKVRRVDMVFKITYEEDLERVEDILKDIIEDHTSTLRSPAPIIKVNELCDYSVDIIVRPWVRTEDYWNVYWDITRQVKLRFSNEGIKAPYPKKDIRIDRE